MESNQTNSRATIITVALGTFMTCFDINATNVALPLMQSGFHTSIAIVEWVVVAYLLTLCATQLTFGRVSDLYGLKKIYVIGFAGFTISSFLCGLATNIILLIVFRVLQALCGAMMMATGNAIVTNSVASSNRGKALSITSISVAVASCAGPSVGGLLASHLGWNSIFFINIPLGIIGTILAVKNIHTDTARANSKFDTIGSTLIMLALVLILLPLDMISKTSVSRILIIISFCIGILMLVAFIFYEMKCNHPILNLALFKNRVFTASIFAATFFYMGEFIIVFLSPYYLQQQRMLSVSVSGLMMLPMSLTMILVAPISGAISDKFDSRFISCTGLGILTAVILSFTFFHVDTPIFLLLIAFAVTGIGVGFFHTPNNSLVMGSAPTNERGVAGATLGTMRNIGMVLGEAISAALLSTNISYATSELSAKGLNGIALKQSAFSYAMRIICIVSACCIICAFILTIARGNAGKVKNENQLKAVIEGDTEV